MLFIPTTLKINLTVSLLLLLYIEKNGCTFSTILSERLTILKSSIIKNTLLHHLDFETVLVSCAHQENI